MADTIRFGVLGSGFMGRTWSEVAANHATGTRLVAVAGGTRAPALASDYRVPLEAGLDALLARTDVDAIVLATPPAGHHDQTLAAAAAGKHVLVEKPMAQDVAECRRMVDACAAAGVRLGVVSHHRFRDVPFAAQRAIADGAIGPVRMIGLTGAEVGWWDTQAYGDAWKLDPRQQTAYASWAAHSCDLVRWFTGSEAVRASAQITNFSGTPPEVGQSAMVIYTMASGALVSIWLSYEFPPPGLKPAWPWLIMGATGIVDMDPYVTARVGRGQGWETIVEQAPFDAHDAVDPRRLRAYARQLEDLVAAIGEGREPYVSGTDGLHTIAMIKAAERSAATHTTVAIAQDGTVG